MALASKYVQLVMLLFVSATLSLVTEANTNFTNGPQNWNSASNFTAGWPWNTPQNYSNSGFNFTAGWPWNRPKIPQTSNRIVVGGDQKWHFGFNYTEWVIKNGPFYLNDTLVFKYDPPSNTTFPHSVYLLPNYRSYVNCDLRRAKRLGSVTQGAGKGFELVLKNWKPYYIACGERNGFHCNVGLMKFTVVPLIRWRY